MGKEYDVNCEACGSSPTTIGVHMQSGDRPVLFFCSEECRKKHFGIS